jgi:hypothetical protein
MSRRDEPSGSPAFFYCATGAAAPQFAFSSRCGIAGRGREDTHFPFQNGHFQAQNGHFLTKKQAKTRDSSLLIGE